MYKLVYVNWYMFYTNSHKRTCIIPICLCELVYLRFVDKNKKTAKSKKRGLPLDPRYVGTCTIDTEKIETDPKKDIEIPSWQKQVLNKT